MAIHYLYPLGICSDMCFTVHLRKFIYVYNYSARCVNCRQIIYLISCMCVVSMISPTDQVRWVSYVRKKKTLWCNSLLQKFGSTYCKGWHSRQKINLRIFHCVCISISGDCRGFGNSLMCLMMITLVFRVLTNLWRCYTSIDHPTGPQT